MLTLRLVDPLAQYYTLHKLLQGLLDVHELVGSAIARTLALRLARYIQGRVRVVVERSGLEHHWTSLNKEFGGLNDVLWRLYRHEQSTDADDGAVADLQLRPIASHFDRPCLLGPLLANEDQLAHMHANTQLPVLQGAVSRYEATGDSDFRRLVSFFVGVLLRTRTFASGGASVGEYWPPANRLGELVSVGEGTTQESCSTHNMMRLVRGLLLTAVDDIEVATHAEYHERALFNSVLGTQRGDRPGEMLYWLPLGAGVSKMDLRHPHHHDGQQHGWSIPHGDFWCCVGSGIEAFARLGDSTFFRLAGGGTAENVGGSDSGDGSDGNDGGDGGDGNAARAVGRATMPTLYVMQLVSSTLTWPAANLRATLVVDEPGAMAADKPLQLALTIAPLHDGSTGVPCQLRLRLPEWASAANGASPEARLHTGGRAAAVSGALPQQGPLLEVVRSSWRVDETLRVELPMTLRAEALADTRDRFKGLQAIMAGPLLLAGLTHGPRTIIADATEPSSWLRVVPPSAREQLRSIVLVATGGGASSAYASASPRGPTVVAGALPTPGAHDAPAATWRVACVPYPCTATSQVAFEQYAQPGAFLAAANSSGGAGGGGAMGAAWAMRILQTASSDVVGADAAILFRAVGGNAMRGGEVQLEARMPAPARLCADMSTGALLLVPRSSPAASIQRCTFRLAQPAARFAPLSMAHVPSALGVRGGGRGFLFAPLKDMIDEAYSVYFYVVASARDAPLECSVRREPWQEEDADSPYYAPASRQLAARVLRAADAKWASMKGLRFEVGGLLQTPWAKGKWGVLPDKEGVLFADFGGAQHELTFETWPAFISSRCSDGDVVRGSMILR